MGRVRISVERTRGEGWWRGAVVSVLLAASCAAPASDQKKEAAVNLDQAIASLFQSGSENRLIRVPIGPGAAKVCAKSEALQSLYTGRGVQAVTGSVPFFPLSQPSDSCHIKITSVPNPGRDLFASPTCRVRVLPDGSVDIWVSKIVTEFTASECFYRLALVLEGYEGGFTAPVFGKYPESFYFSGKRKYVGPIVAPAVQHLVRKCPGIVKGYYQKNLSELAHTECGVARN